jgi:hypothetical protein
MVTTTDASAPDAPGIVRTPRIARWEVASMKRRVKSPRCPMAVWHTSSERSAPGLPAIRARAANVCPPQARRIQPVRQCHLLALISEVVHPSIRAQIGDGVAGAQDGTTGGAAHSARRLSRAAKRLHALAPPALTTRLKRHSRYIVTTGDVAGRSVWCGIRIRAAS